MSTAFGILTIVKALQEAEGFIGGKNWQAMNANQTELLRRMPSVRQAMSLVPTLKGWAKDNAEELNRILEEEGLSIRLNPWARDANHFGVVSVNKFGIRWLCDGETEDQGSPILVQNKPAFRLKKKAKVAFLNRPHSNDPIIEIPTKTGDIAYLTKWGRPTEGFELIRYIEELEQGASTDSHSNYSGAVIPMVKMATQPDMTWLLGLENGPWFVSQALQEVQYAMNHKGADVVEGTAVAFTRSAPMHYYLDTDFLMWITRPGVSAPLFAAHITQDDWSDPGELTS